MLTLLVLAIGLEGVDRALLERAMDSLIPPRQPSAWYGLLHPEPIKAPPPPPPPSKQVTGDAWVGN